MTGPVMSRRGMCRNNAKSLQTCLGKIKGLTQTCTAFDRSKFIKTSTNGSSSNFAPLANGFVAQWAQAGIFALFPACDSKPLRMHDAELPVG